MNFAALLDVHTRARPDAPALHYQDRTWSWRDLSVAVNRVAFQLRQAGVRPEDRVALLFHNSPEFVVGFLASLKLAACPVPLNTRWSADEIAFVLSDADAGILLARAEFAAVVGGESASKTRVVLGGAELEHWLDEPTPLVRTVPRQGDDMADLMYTAGTSGHPKGVVHHHEFHWAGAFGRAEFFDFSQDDVGLSVSALFHIGGLSVMTVAIALGCQLVILPRWDVGAFFHAIDAYRVTYMHLVTTVLLDIVQADASVTRLQRPSSVRATFGGGGSATLEQLAEFERRVGGVYCEGYGRTEASGVCWNPPDVARRVAGSNGMVLEDVARLRIIDPSGHELPPCETGEIVVKGDGVARRYWRRPDLDAATFDAEGWMHTGDIGYTDHDGFLYFQGRDDQMIKTGGENVYPSEVEGMLLAMPGIAEAAVVGVADPRLGHRVAALLVRTSPDLSADDVDRWCRERLAGFKRPRQIRFVDSLEKLGSLKVNYASVRELLSEPQIETGSPARPPAAPPTTDRAG